MFRFCFVRNPYTRLLSAWLDKIQGNQFQKSAITQQLGLGEDVSQPISFEQFVDAVVAQPVINMDQHWRVQYDQTYQTRIEYDQIGRFENFQHDLIGIMEKIGIDHQAYYRREAIHATSAGEKVRTHYTDALAEKVYEKYRIDFDHFGYDQALPV